MNIYDFTNSPEYLPVSFEDMNSDYEASNMPIRFFRLGPCLVGQQMNRSEVRIFAPSKGAGYVANKKLARKYRKSEQALFRSFEKLPVTVSQISEQALKEYFCK